MGMMRRMADSLPAPVPPPLRGAQALTRSRSGVQALATPAAFAIAVVVVVVVVVVVPFGGGRSKRAEEESRVRQTRLPRGGKDGGASAQEIRRRCLHHQARSR